MTKSETHDALTDYLDPNVKFSTGFWWRKELRLIWEIWLNWAHHLKRNIMNGYYQLLLINCQTRSKKKDRVTPCPPPVFTPTFATSASQRVCFHQLDVQNICACIAPLHPLQQRLRYRSETLVNALDEADRQQHRDHCPALIDKLVGSFLKISR